MLKKRYTVGIWITLVLLLVAMSGLALAQAPEGQEYVVQVDDWLSKIAEKEYGDPLAYPAIVEATNAKAAEDDSFAVIDNPDLIEVGQKLWLPTTAESGAMDSMAPAMDGSRLTDDQLKNATYSGIYDDPVTLTNGLYEGEPFVEGGASRPSVQFIDDSAVYGDLNGDGVEDAAVLLVESSGGSGVFTYLGAQLNQAGQPVDGGTVWVGDRTQIKSMAIENGQAVLEVVTQGPNDPQCCPTAKVRKTYALQDGKLAEAGSEELGSVSLQDLNGTSWVLQDFNFDQQPVSPDTEITAEFADGQISGSAGCNNYNAPLSSDGGQALTVGPVISTQVACPEPQMSEETEYLAALQGAMQWSYLSGKLALTYQNQDGSIGTLVFESQASADQGTAEATMMTEVPTEVINYTPTEIPTESQAGSCFTNAIGLGREDAYRCMVGNQIYDPCFTVGDDAPTVVCGANPATGETGFVLELTEPLPAPVVGNLAQPWLVELADGQVCGLMTGTVPGVGDRVAPYGCPDGSNLFEDFQQGEVWLAEKAIIGVNENGYFIEQSEMVPLARVWQ